MGDGGVATRDSKVTASLSSSTALWRTSHVTGSNRFQRGADSIRAQWSQSLWEVAHTRRPMVDSIDTINRRVGPNWLKTAGRTVRWRQAKRVRRQRMVTDWHNIYNCPTNCSLLSQCPSPGPDVRHSHCLLYGYRDSRFTLSASTIARPCLWPSKMVIFFWKKCKIWE